MKKLFLITGSILISFASYSQVADSINHQKLSSIMYCISTDGGKMLLTHEGKAISEDVHLASGAVLTTAGKITWSDKSQTKLNAGYCIDEAGTIYAPRLEPEQKKKVTAIAH